MVASRVTAAATRSRSVAACSNFCRLVVQVFIYLERVLVRAVVADVDRQHVAAVGETCGGAEPMGFFFWSVDRAPSPTRNGKVVE